MENKMKKRYGFPMALAMVIGVVIGSGIFVRIIAILFFAILPVIIIFSPLFIFLR